MMKIIVEISQVGVYIFLHVILELFDQHTLSSLANGEEVGKEYSLMISCYLRNMLSVDLVG